jgi:hypothetical protein
MKSFTIGLMTAAAALFKKLNSFYEVHDIEISGS